MAPRGCAGSENAQFGTRNRGSIRRVCGRNGTSDADSGGMCREPHSATRTMDATHETDQREPKPADPHPISAVAHCGIDVKIGWGGDVDGRSRRARPLDSRAREPHGQPRTHNPNPSQAAHERNARARRPPRGPRPPGRHGPDARGADSAGDPHRDGPPVRAAARGVDAFRAPPRHLPPSGRRPRTANASRPCSRDSRSTTCWPWSRSSPRSATTKSSRSCRWSASATSSRWSSTPSRARAGS